jgi:tetratricopeptide (TPR) repeat protein
MCWQKRRLLPVIGFIVFMGAGVGMAGDRPTADLPDTWEFPGWKPAIPPESRQYARKLYDEALRLAEDPADEGAAMENLKHALAYDPDLMEAWYAFGRILYKNERYEEADGLLSLAQTRNGARAEGYYLLGLTEYMRGAYRHARRSLQRFLDSEDPNLGDEPRRIAHELLGRIALSENRYGEAIRWMTAALNAQPENWEFLYLRGLAFLRGNVHRKAAEDFRRAAQLNPSHPAFWNGLAWALLLEQEFRFLQPAPELYRPALEAAKRAVELGPSIAENHFLLGRIYEKQKRPREAAEAFRHAVRLRPDNAVLRLRLAQNLLRVPDETAHAEAERHLIQGLALDYDLRIKDPLSRNVSKLLDVLLRHYLLHLRLREAEALLEWARDSTSPETR